MKCFTRVGLHNTQHSGIQHNGLVMTLSIDIHHNSIECHYSEYHYAECFDYLNVTLSVIRLNVVMLSVKAPLM
jgi:hypothetical protein